jgi:hypothetical protein
MRVSRRVSHRKVSFLVGSGKSVALRRWGAGGSPVTRADGAILRVLRKNPLSLGCQIWELRASLKFLLH